jgi:hypothetical protein
MPKLIGGLAAFIAIAAGILNSVEPLTIVLRAALALILGSLLTQLWYVFFTVRVSNDVAQEGKEDPQISEELEIPAKAA